jgi:hypothetical protein
LKFQKYFVLKEIWFHPPDHSSLFFTSSSKDSPNSLVLDLSIGYNLRKSFFIKKITNQLNKMAIFPNHL